LSCEYFRERKKRGKASRKDLALQQAASASNNASHVSPSGYSSDDPSPTHSNQEPHLQESRSAANLSASNIRRTMSYPEGTAGPLPIHASSDMIRSTSVGIGMDPGARIQTIHQLQLSGMHEGTQGDGQMAHVSRGQMGDDPTPVSLNGFSLLHEYSKSELSGMSSLNVAHSFASFQGLPQLPSALASANDFSSLADAPYGLMNGHKSHIPPVGFPFGRTGDSPMPNFMSPPTMGSPAWLSLPSPSCGPYQSQHALNPSNAPRYPVLQPLVSSLGSILPISLACDLLELYFASSSSAHPHPLSPYVLGYIFRKKSILHPTRPRSCSPALLTSILWVGAQTIDAPFLSSPPAVRGRICQKLLELTVGLLKPLVHGPCSSDSAPNFGVSSVANSIALGGLSIELGQDQLSADGGTMGGLDDVVTYYNLAIVFSASEYKAASTRWWNAAWSLARELRLGRELPPQPSQREHHASNEQDQDADVDPEMHSLHKHSGAMEPRAPGTYTEEEREERRRTWWLLYIVDRHLALCYNRPIFLLDVECEGLLQPVGDAQWQAGEMYTGDSTAFPRSGHPQQYRRLGPSFKCTGHGIFEWLLPLMAILGEVVDLNHSRNHPRFGLGFRGGNEWDDQVAEISDQLEAYGRSLKEFETRYTASLDAEPSETERNDAGTQSGRSVNSHSSRLEESIIQTKIVVAYGTHLMHVLHVLLTGKWDPISLLDDNDLWISSQSFLTATGHAVSAAEAISSILEYDPDLSFCPYFFGIYLLQGSFLLLLIADKLQGEASPSVVRACETIVRAHEACVVTLNTEYQVCFIPLAVIGTCLSARAITAGSGTSGK
jgi:hypothetical protein